MPPISRSRPSSLQPVVRSRSSAPPAIHRPPSCARAREASSDMRFQPAPPRDRWAIPAGARAALGGGGAVARLIVTRGQAARLLQTRDAEPDKTFIELWLALATPP